MAIQAQPGDLVKMVKPHIHTHTHTHTIAHLRTHTTGGKALLCKGASQSVHPSPAIQEALLLSTAEAFI